MMPDSESAQKTGPKTTIVGNITGPFLDSTNIQISQIRKKVTKN